MDTGAPADTQDSALPPPPPTRPGTADNGSRASRWATPHPMVGQLTPGWRVVFGFGWALITAGLAAVWESSRIIGLSTWWLGADAQPHVLPVQLLPFYGPIVVMLASVSHWRYLPYLGIAVAATGAAIGVGDLGRVRWIAVVELVLAAAGLCISVASLAGMYRRGATVDPVS